MNIYTSVCTVSDLDYIAAGCVVPAQDIRHVYGYIYTYMDIYICVCSVSHLDHIAAGYFVPAQEDAAKAVELLLSERAQHHL